MRTVIFQSRGSTLLLWRLHHARGLLLRRDVREILLMALAFTLYFAVRSAVVDQVETAYDNALRIVDLERGLGIFWEPDVNASAEASQQWRQAASLVYFWLLFPFMIVFGFWLYYRRPGMYPLVRDAFLVSGAIGLIFFWLLPAAPPRELPALAARYDVGASPDILGFVDTVRVHLRYAHDSQSTGFFVNNYAAMPALHVGWDLLLGWAIIRAFWKERWVWIALPAGVSLPVLQSLAVVATANHYVLDIVVGLLVALIAIPTARHLRVRLYPAVGRASFRLAAAVPRPPPISEQEKMS